MDNNTCLLFPDDPTKCDAIILIKRINASISLICCLLTLFIVWLFKFYQLFAYRLVAYLTVATLFDCIIYLVGQPQENSAACRFEAFWLTYSDWNVVLWVVFITVYLFLSVVKQQPSDKFEKLYVVTGFVAPLLPAALPLAGSAYGPAGAWCWITETGWRMAVWFVPVLLILLSILAAYALIMAAIRRRSSAWSGMHAGSAAGAEAAAQQEQIYPLLAFPCVFLAIQVLPFVNRINNAVSDTASFPLHILSALSAPLIGSLNFLLFYLHPGVRKKVTPSGLMMQLQASARPEAVVQEYTPGQEQFSRFENEGPEPGGESSVINSGDRDDRY